MMPISGQAAFTARIVLQTRFSGLSASEPTEFLRELAVAGKIAIAGIPNFLACFAASTAADVESRYTRGIVAIATG